MKHFIKSQLTRKAAEGAASASAASVGSLPSASAANSAGASTNLAEISHNLDPLLNRLTEEERLTIAEENIADRLRRLCDMYPESRVPEGLQSWLYDDDTLSMVCLAADCAEAIYNHNPKTMVPGVTLDASDYAEMWQLAASQSGAFKATAIKLHKSSKTCVVAVRGTRKTSPIDWLTNANGAPDDATEFLPGIPDVKAHSGFLFAAKNMCDPIVAAIKPRQAEASSVLLTGHSAGGAVAALLYARLQFTNPLGIPVHCVTFAAPPVLSPTDIAQSCFPVTSAEGEAKGRFLAFAVQGDIVVRADRPYIRKILEIYSTGGAAMTAVPTLQFEGPELRNAGKLILLFDKNPDGDQDQIEAVEAGNAIGSVLWGNVRAHPMRLYCEMLAQLKQASGLPFRTPGDYTALRYQ